MEISSRDVNPGLLEHWGLFVPYNTNSKFKGIPVSPASWVETEQNGEGILKGLSLLACMCSLWFKRHKFWQKELPALCLRTSAENIESKCDTGWAAQVLP